MATLKDMFDGLKSRAANGFDKVSSGLRGQPATPGAEAAPTDPNQVRNTNLLRGSPEAEAYRASQGKYPGGQPLPGQPAGPAPVESTSYQMGKRFAQGLRGGGVAGRMGAFGGAIEEAPKVNAVFNSDMSDIDKNTQFAEGAAKVGGGAAGALTGAAGGAAVGSVVGPIGTVVGGLAGGTLGYLGGTRLTDAAIKYGRRMVGTEESSPYDRLKNPVAAKTGAPVASMPPAVQLAQADIPQAPVDNSDLIDTTKGTQVTPSTLMNDTSLLPAKGQGAFQRTTAGNVGPAVGIRNAEVKPGEGAPLSKSNKLANAAAQIAAAGYGVRAAEARESGNRFAANLGIKQLQAGLAARHANQEYDSNNRKQLDTQAETYARQAVGPQKTSGLLGSGIGGEKDADYENRVKGEKADFMRRADFSFADRNDGKKLEDATPRQFQQLTILNNIRKKVVEGRSDFTQQLRDFFGNKQSDSQNLYHYGPKDLKASLLPGGGGYHVQLAGGDTVNLVTAAGGGYKVLGPNTPVDSDIMALIKHTMEQKGKK